MSERLTKPNQDYIDLIEKLLCDIPRRYPAHGDVTDEGLVIGGFRRLGAVHPKTDERHFLFEANYVSEQGDNLAGRRLAYATDPRDSSAQRTICIDMETGELSPLLLAADVTYDLREEFGARLRMINAIPPEFRGPVL